jgi:CRISPR-associated protein Csc1
VDNPRYNTVAAEEDAYTYFCAEQVPKYEQHLIPLNQQGIYVTPARAQRHTSVLNTWKYADNHYHVEMKPTSKNIPSFGRTKEIAPESQFEFFVIARSQLIFPRWVRMGKWASKAELVTEILEINRHNSKNEFIFPYPLNPLDVMATHQVLSFDTINMPPVSLIQNVRLIGDFYSINGNPNLKFPYQLQYCF